MTRDGFIESINYFTELLEWCNANDCYVYDGVVDYYDYDRNIINEISDQIADGNNWTDILRFLSDLPTEYEYYRCDDYGNWHGLDEYDFDVLKQDALDWGDDHGVWDTEEEEAEEEEEEVPTVEEPDPEDEIPVETEDVSIDDLFSSCSSEAQVIRAKQIEEWLNSTNVTLSEPEPEQEPELDGKEEWREFVNDIVVLDYEGVAVRINYTYAQDAYDALQDELQAAQE